MNFVKEENLWLLERRTIMDLQYNIRTKLLHLDMTFTEPVVTDWLKKSIIALSAVESWWNNMKINDIKNLIADYGESTTLKDVLKKVQENRKYKCPKCGGSGKITIRKNVAEYWECSDRYEYNSIECDLCNGEGYTEHEYKPKMVQDGWQ